MIFADNTRVTILLLVRLLVACGGKADRQPTVHPVSAAQGVCSGWVGGCEWCSVVWCGVVWCGVVWCEEWWYQLLCKYSPKSDEVGERREAAPLSAGGGEEGGSQKGGQHRTTSGDPHNNPKGCSVCTLHTCVHVKVCAIVITYSDDGTTNCTVHVHFAYCMHFNFSKQQLCEGSHSSPHTYYQRIPFTLTIHLCSLNPCSIFSLGG